MKFLYFPFRFSDLLALADDIEADFKSVRVLRGVPARKAANASAAMGLDNRSSSRKTSKKVVHESSGSSDSSEVSTTSPMSNTNSCVIRPMSSLYRQLC